MARKPFKIVNNLDLSGNQLIDVSRIYRESYNQDGLGLDLHIIAGSDSAPASLPHLTGGTLHLRSGLGGTSALPGAVHMYVASGNEATTESNAYGITLAGDTAALIKTNNQDITLTTGNNNAVQITSTLAVDPGTSAGGDASGGALQIAGGLYVGDTAVIAGAGICTDYNLGPFGVFNTCATAINAFGEATTLNIAVDSTGAKTVNIATGGISGLGTSTVVIGTDALGSETTLRGHDIHLGSGSNAATTVTLGGNFSGNTLDFVSPTTGTINLTTDVTTGTVNVFNEVTSGAVNLFNKATNVHLSQNVVTDVQIGTGASVVHVGTANATLYVGSSSGTITTESAGSTANVFNTNATTVNAFGAATTLNLGNATSEVTLSGTDIIFPQANNIEFNGTTPVTLSANAVTLSLFDDAQTTVEAFGAATSVDMGASVGTFSINNLTFQLDNATTFTASKLATINVGTSAASNVITTVGVGGRTNTLNLNGSTITVATNSTGTANLFDTNATTINAFGAATAINVGFASSVVNIDSTIDSGDLSTGALIVDGGVAIAKQLRVGGNTTLGNAATDTATIRGLVTLTDNSATYPLRLGTDVNLYRSNTNVLTIDDHVIINGVSGAATIDSANTVTLFASTETLDIGNINTVATFKHDVVIDNDLELKGTLPYLVFSREATAPITRTPGLLYYLEGSDYLSFTPYDIDVELDVGQEEYIRVHNATGATIPNGTVIAAATGATNGVLNVVKAQANTDAGSIALGVTTHDIASGADGFATAHGLVRDFIVAGLTTGIVYLSATTPGLVTNTPPSEGNHVVVVGYYIDGTDQSLYVNIHQSWTTKAVYKNLHASLLEAYNEFQLPTLTTSASTTEGSMFWDSDDNRLRVRSDSTWQEFVDLNSTQSLSNKTYNALTLTAQTPGFTIAGGSASKTLDVDTNTTFDGTGNLTITANASGSTLVLPASTLKINTLTSGYPIYASAANTISTEQYLHVQRGGTGIGSWTSNRLYKGQGTSPLAVSSILDSGSAVTLDTGVDFNMSGDGVLSHLHNSTSVNPSVIFRNEGVKADSTTAVKVEHLGTGGSIDEKRALDITSTGAWSNNNIAVKATASGGSNNYSFYGVSGRLYNADDVLIDGDLTVNGGDVNSSAAVMNLFNASVTTLNVLGAASSTMNIGGSSANSSTRQVNMYADFQLGSATNERYFDLYGDMRVGGPAGFVIDWNATDDSLDFIRL
jgi:hypothetical protein